METVGEQDPNCPGYLKELVQFQIKNPVSVENYALESQFLPKASQ